jgi:hypothetical protein
VCRLWTSWWNRAAEALEDVSMVVQVDGSAGVAYRTQRHGSNRCKAQHSLHLAPGQVLQGMGSNRSVSL